MAPMIRKQIYLEVHQETQLKARAKANGVSEAELIMYAPCNRMQSTKALCDEDEYATVCLIPFSENRQSNSLSLCATCKRCDSNGALPLTYVAR